MVYTEGQTATWMQQCVFQDGIWQPKGKPFLSVRGLKSGATAGQKKAAVKKVESNNNKKLVDSLKNTKLEEFGI